MKPQKPEVGGKALPSGKRRTEQLDVGMTALMFSSQTGSTECVRRLLWASAEVNAVEEDGGSPLHFAAKECHFEVCEALLKGRANPGLVNGDDKTPLQIAIEEEEDDFAEKLQRLLEGTVAFSLAKENDSGDGKEGRQEGSDEQQ